MSPTARTLAMLREQGYLCAIVEKVVPRSFIKQDLFGFIDIIAVRADGYGCVGVQSTANVGGHHAERVRKILAEPRALIWLGAGNTILIVSWAKQGPRGKRKHWVVRVQEITMKDFDENARHSDQPARAVARVRRGVE